MADNIAICREHNKLELRVRSFPPSRCGQFVQVKCRAAEEPAHGIVIGEERVHEWEPATRFDPASPDALQPTPVLRRPFSLAGRVDDDEGTLLTLINRDIGPGTHWLSGLKPGDEVDLIGPLGNGFTLPEPGGVALLVGGGVGIPPMIYVAQEIAAKNDGADDDDRIKAVAFCGALTRDLLSLTITDDAPEPPAGLGDESLQPLYNVAEFSPFGVAVSITTDDGSYAYAGRVTEALSRYLDRFYSDSWEVGSKRPTIYTCGPEPMMMAVAKIALERGLDCQVAVERAMACGMGTCQSCVIRQAAENDPGWIYKLACTDGPVFEASTLRW